MILKKLFSQLGLGSDEPNGAVTKDTLFPLATQEEKECLKECDGCAISFPRKFDVDRSDELWGRVNEYSVHVLVATGKSDWLRDVVDEKGSVMEAIGKERETRRKGKGKGKEGHEVEEGVNGKGRAEKVIEVC